MSQVKEKLKKVQQLKDGETTLLHEAHELVINEKCPDLPEALDFITDQENKESLMNLLIMEEEYEQCAQILKDKQQILSEMKTDC